MRTRRTHWILTLLTAGMLLTAAQSQAYYTNFLDVASNALTFARATLTNNTPQERRTAVAIDAALRELAKPSTSVAGDYALFLKAATRLGPLATSPAFEPIGFQVFNLFTNEAQAQITATAARIASLSEFVRAKKQASAQLAKAQALLHSLSSISNPQIALLVGGQVFGKIIAANRFVTAGEARPGFAPNSLAGRTAAYVSKSGDSGSITFVNGTDYTEVHDGHTGTYTYERTGLNTARLVTQENDNPGSSSTVILTFTSPTKGRFTARDSSGARDSGTLELD